MAFGSVAEHCLPSLLRALLQWYGRQGVVDWAAPDTKGKTDPSKGKGSVSRLPLIISEYITKIDF